MDVLGAAASAAQLLEGAIRLLKRVRKAYERYESLTEALDKHVLEIDSINAIIVAIVDEEALQTATVAVELTKLCTIGTKLMKRLKELHPGNKGVVRQLAHQLVHGTREEETLADIMAELDRAKAYLCLRVQLANVGLTRMIHDTVVANVEVINRIDRLLTEIMGESNGLKLAGLLEDVHLQADGNLVCLKKSEIVSLSQIASNSNEEATDRIIVGNTARGSAIQLLGPIGQDLWEDIRVRIEHNTASGNATQIAYPTDFATFKYLLEHQERVATLMTG